MIVDLVAGEVSSLSCKPVPNCSGGGGKPIVEKFYDWYCHTHGVNISHGTKLDGSAYKPCENPGPKHEETATFRDPKGGNTKRNDKAGKVWRNGKVTDAWSLPLNCAGRGCNTP